MSKKNVVLICANGFTTTMLRNKIREEVEKRGLGYNVEAYPLSEAERVAEGADILLIGPQIRFKFAEMQKKYPDKPVVMIDSQSVAFTDGVKVLQQVIDAFEK